MRTKIVSIMLLSMLLLTGIAGLSTGLRVESNNEVFNYLRVDIIADSKLGEGTEYVYVDFAEITVKKIDEDSGEVVDAETAEFVEETILFEVPTCIYNASLVVEEGYYYRVSVEAEGYKKVQEDISYEEFTDGEGYNGEPLTVITIEKRLFSNIEKTKIGFEKDSTYVFTKTFTVVVSDEDGDRVSGAEVKIYDKYAETEKNAAIAFTNSLGKARFDHRWNDDSYWIIKVYYDGQSNDKWETFHNELAMGRVRITMTLEDLDVTRSKSRDFSAILNLFDQFPLLQRLIQRL